MPNKHTNVVNQMRNILYWSIILLALVLSSCSSTQRLTVQKNKTEQLSRKLGFTVNKRDNLPLFEEVSLWIGTPYRYGGTNRTGADCSGFVSSVYKNVYQKSLQRTVTNIYNKDCQRIRKRRVKSGDLVFFNFSKKKRRGLTHVGIFLKNGYFVHASTSQGVIISHLSENYYKKGWRKSGRIW